MTDQKKYLVSGLLVAGLGLVALSAYFGLFSKSRFSQNLILGRVEREVGKSFLYTKGFSQRQSIEQSLDLKNDDAIETLESGEVSIQLENGYRLRLAANSFASIERNADSGELLLTLSRGEVRVEQVGRDQLFFISRNGEKIPGAEYQSRQFEELVNEPPFQRPMASANGTDKAVLTEEEIHTVLNGQRSSFFKCYAQLLQAEPQAQGMLSLIFTIETNGKVSEARVDSQSFKQSDFHKCLIDILKRLNFRSFDGPTISTVFPMKFE